MMLSKHNLTFGSHRPTSIPRLAVALILGMVASPSPVFGLGSALPDQNAFATARGNAFVAAASDPSAFFYNPDGISQWDGVNISLGAYGIVLSDRYTGPKGSVDSMNSAPDANFNPLVPDSDRYIFSMGAGKKCGSFSWDVAYQFGWGPSRSVAGDATAFGTPDGKYEFFSDALTINFG